MTLSNFLFVLLMIANTPSFMSPSLFGGIGPKSRSLLLKQNHNEGNQYVNRSDFIHGLNTIFLFLCFAPSIILPSPSLAVPTALVDQNEMFTNSRNPRQQRAIQDLRNLKALEDSRLDMCADRGKNWEHCFIFGDSTTKDSIPGSTRLGRLSHTTDSQNVRSKSSNKPPTW